MQFPLKKTQVNSLESTALCSMEIDLQYGLREKEKKEEKKNQWPCLDQVQHCDLIKINEYM